MRVSLQSTSMMPTAGGRADLNFQTGEIRIIATGMPNIETFNLAGNDKRAIYQVWWENDNGISKLGVLKKGLDKTHFLNILVSRIVMQQIKRLIITVEPESGAVTPGEHVIATAELEPKS